MEDENKLLEISINPNTSLPNLFRHRSIKESITSSINDICSIEVKTPFIKETVDTYQEDIFDMSIDDNELGMKLHNNENYLSLSSDSFLSLDGDANELHNSFLDEPTSPIYITNFNRDLRNQSTILITRDMIDHNEEGDSNSLSESIKKYLMSSISFIKESYKYISHGNTI